MKKIEKVSFIGAGHVATSLVLEMFNSRIIIQQIYSRSLESAKILADLVHAEAIQNTEDLQKDIDLLICAIPDQFLDEVLHKIPFSNFLITHTSGSIPMSVFSQKYKNYGVFYPLQTFSKTKPISLQEVPLCLEANKQSNYQLLENLASRISKHIYPVSSEQRKILHVAAVFACNFPNFLYQISDQILKKHKLNFSILQSLIQETTNKVKFQSPQEAQTGPAIRHDLETIDKHIRLLSDEKDAREIYQLLSNKIMKNNEL